MEGKAVSDKLRMWQERLSHNENEYKTELDKMDAREALYRGDNRLKPLTPRDAGGSGGRLETPHVRNIVAENIESLVSSSIPQPKVTARRKKDERLAKLIEDMLRNELDRLPMEYLNDMQERTVPIQGGSFYHIEWDNRLCTHTTVGEVIVTARHPKQVIPQAGVYTSVEDMDYIILKLPQTKAAIRQRYGVDVSDESEREPDIRSTDGENPAKDVVTQYIAYYRNGRGGIGLYSWVCDTELADWEDYQARRLRHCKKCGALEPTAFQQQPPSAFQQQTAPFDPFSQSNPLGQLGQLGQSNPLGQLGPPEQTGQTEQKPWHSGDPCPNCGANDWESREEEFQELWEPVYRSDGSIIPGATLSIDPVSGWGSYTPNKIPYYKPNVYPLVLQRNVSVFGQLLGDSDVDKISDQQNTINRLEKKIIDRLIKAGSRIIMPGNAVSWRMDPEDNEIFYAPDVADASMIQVKDFTGNLQYELTYLSQVYEETRQTLGITDSYQGRKDSTATSGKAKEFAAAQSAGRLESKRLMKDAAYADLFRLIFQFKLAYADEPRPVVSQGSQGETIYSAGTWFWNDQFLFATDTSAPLANNRERMWEETVSLFTSGCFGNPSEMETLIALWTKLELLHYPGAGDTRKYLEEKQAQLQAQQAQTQQAQGYYI